MRKEVFLLLADYKTSEIKNASNSFIKGFAEYSDIEGTRDWIRNVLNLWDVIENQKPTKLRFKGEGIEIIFSGFPNPIPKIVGEEVLYAPIEPRFTIFDTVRDDLLVPSSRNAIEDTVSQISDEMQSVYKMHVEESPLSLVFPRSEYASRVRTVKANLIFPSSQV